VHSLEEARGWIEARVDDVYGARVGVVTDVYFDPEDQEVHWLLLRVGSGDGPLVPVPVHYSIATSGQVWVPITKDLILKAPPSADGAPGVTRDEELELCFHYGGLRARAVELRQRGEDELTCVPGGAVLPFRPG